MNQSTSALTDAQARSFAEEGYVIGKSLLEPQDFSDLKDLFEEKFAALPADGRPEDMDVPHFTDPGLFRWLMAPRVLDTVESIIGPNIALLTSHFFCKAAGDGKSVPWHTDGYFWREMLTPSNRAVTIWLALDPSTLENGCMTVIPDSRHSLGGTYRRTSDEGSVFDEELDPSLVDPESAVPIELKPNDFSVHSADLIHASARNFSSIRRCGYTMRYVSTEVTFHEGRVGDRHQIFLARGKDLAGNTYADPFVPHPELVQARGSGQKFVGSMR